MSSRRNFIRQTALASGATLLSPAISSSAFASWKKSIAPSDQINIAAIGINGMGWSNVTAALKVPGINLVGLCDVDSNVMDKRMGELKKNNQDGKIVKNHLDYKELLDRKDVDAVIIGTPDHWHALQMIHACEAGKHVYVEKPVGNSIAECRAMVKAQQKYNRIVQAGQWQRSQQHFTDAINYVHSGQLGNIRTVKVWCYLDWKQPLEQKPNGPVPAGVDYTRWLGPAPKREFNPNRFHFTFRWFWDYAGGLMTDWGVHLLDYALMGMKVANPKSIVSVGGKFAKPDSADETPDTLMVLYEFDNFNIVWDHAIGIGNGNYGKDHGIAFIGTNGTLVLNRRGWEVVEEKKNAQKVAKEWVAASDVGLDKHWVNFAEVIRSGNQANLKCPIQAGSDIACFSQMGNIAYRSGEKIHWDAAKQAFKEEAINRQYLSKTYYNGYQLPKV